METQDFETKLSAMTKPEVTQLQHQDLLAETILKAKDKFVLSVWWIIIPLYVIAALLMKSLYMPRATLLLSLHEFADKQRVLSGILFGVMPLLFICLNGISLWKTWQLFGTVKYALLNLVIILFSVLILFIYLLSI